MKKKHYKIVCVAQIYNELEKGNLKRFIKHVMPLCDALVVYDDASTDGSYEYVKKFTPYVIKGKENSFVFTNIHRQLLLEKALRLKPDFIFYLDADEVLTIQSKEVLQKLGEYCIKKNVDALQFHKINLWRSASWQRIDSLFDIGWFAHFWKVKPGLRYTYLREAIHKPPYPPQIKKIERCEDVSVLHYGFANEKNIAYKYLTYKMNGQRGEVILDRIIDEKSLTLRKVPKIFFPPDLYVADEPKPKKKSFEQALQYVKKYENQVFKLVDPKKKPLVSIVTATYNRKKLLKETLESVLSQSYENLEYIIVDDGSQDNTEALVKTIKKKYPKRKIIYVKQKNAGETKAVNKGFSLAHGEIISVVSSDDPLLPHAVLLMVNYFHDNPEISVVYPDWEIIDKSSKSMGIVRVEDYDFTRMIKEFYCMPGPGTFFKRECLKITGGRDESLKYNADFYFWIKIGMQKKIKRNPKVLGSFRIHHGSQGVYAKGDEMAKETIRLVDMIYSDPHLPKQNLKMKNATLSSAYFMAASQSISNLNKMKYYLLSLITNVNTFLSKIRYELVKIRKRIFNIPSFT